MHPVLEVCVDNYESMISAEQAGVPRLEVCSSLLDGGLTPSREMVEQYSRHRSDAAVESQKSDAGRMSLYIMIRPRGGDFCYSQDEIDIMVREIEHFKSSADVDGFVFGCLKSDATIDVDANRRLLDAATPKLCTFHRAFDMVREAKQSVEQLIELGFVRVLTSGQRENAEAGIETIAELVKHVGDRIIVMPGAGITPDNAERILRETGAKEFHSSASVVKRSPMVSNIEFGGRSSGSDYKVCCPIKARRLLEIATLF